MEGNSSTDDARPLGPPRIQRQPSFIEFMPKRAMQSFENLVALANHQESLRSARKIVWRDRGEAPKELSDVFDCFEHAGRGALRAGMLAFNIRAGINLVLALFRLKRIPKATRFAFVRRAVLGPESFRFAAMLGSFVYLYKLIFNSLPFAFPDERIEDSPFDEDAFASDSGLRLTRASPDVDEGSMSPPTVQTRRRPRMHQARLSLSASAREQMVRKKTRRWHATVAGAIAGGVAIMFERRRNRLAIAQQMFVRGLQGEYNHWAPKYGIHVPNGPVVVFALCCGQIMYAWLMRPETQSPSYNHWILQASRVTPEAVNLNYSLTRQKNFDLNVMQRVINSADITPSNRTELIGRTARAVTGDFGPGIIPCEALHPWVNSCRLEQLNRFQSVFRWIAPIYAALHFIPAVLFKRKEFMRKPGQMLLRAALGTARSSAFLGVFVVIYQIVLCGKRNMYDVLSSPKAPFRTPKAIREFLLSRRTFWIGGFLSGLSLFIEEPRRRPELAMYVLPKALESAWIMLRGRGLVFKTGEGGEALLTALGMAMVMSVYQNEPQHLSGLVRRIIYQFVGPN